MVGLGETIEEIKEVMLDLRSWGVDILTIICLLGYSFLVSLLLTSIGLLCGTASRRSTLV